MKSLIVKDSYYFKLGEIVEGKQTKGGLLINEHFIKEGSYIILSEALTPQDEERVKTLVRDILKRFLWRAYTRNSFLLQ